MGELVGRVEVEMFDVSRASPAQVADFSACVNAHQAEVFPEDPLTPVEAIAAGWRAQPAFFRHPVWLARVEGGQVAGYAQAFLRDDQNRHIVSAGIEVIREYRRRGIGRALLGRLAALAENEGRELLISSTLDRVPAGETFCRRIGAHPALGVHTNRLILAEVDRELLRVWMAQGFEREQDYRLIDLEDDLPEELLGPLAELLAVMNDAPRGELQVEDETLGPEELREQIQMFRADGTELWWLVARDRATGELVGFTEVSWNRLRPATVYQGDTGVLPTHRGQAIGKWLKAVMLEKILQRRPEAVDVRTGNADDNAAMLAINRRIGFQPYTAITNWQISRSEVKAYLS